MRRKRYPCFLNKWLHSQCLSDGLVHAFSPMRANFKHPDGSRTTQSGFSPYCAKGLSFNDLPGEARTRTEVTCIQCLGALKT